MKLKKTLKKFFEPNWNKIIIVLLLEFLLTMLTLNFGDNMSVWVYLLSPSALYLETMVDFIFSSQGQLAFHGAVSNVIALSYLYFLSCLIDELYGRVRK